MKTIANRKWMVRDKELAARIRSWLGQTGGVEEQVTGAHELWRVRQSDAKWTYYTTGTLYVTDSDNPALLEAQRHVDQMAGARFVEPTRDLLIGLDETGKGEVFGPVILAAVTLPRPLFGQIEEIIGVADTKVRHNMRYWEELFGRIDFYRPQGLRWSIASISPAEFDRISVNRLLDSAYENLLDDVMGTVDPKAARVVVDDYGVGWGLDRRLRQMASAGAEIARATHADDRYLECRLASLIAKREQQKNIEAIRRDKRFQIEGQELGSGNAGDPKTIAWLRAWRQSGRAWPEFVKQSFRTIQEIEGRPASARRPKAAGRTNGWGGR
jgi:ribonuclease HII